jgi:CheY-like chemotaxis protein
MPVLLVIDDDSLTLDCCRLLFPKGKVSVNTATSASEGLKLFSEGRPNAVVLDVRLPDL